MPHGAAKITGRALHSHLTGADLSTFHWLAAVSPWPFLGDLKFHIRPRRTLTRNYDSLEIRLALQQGEEG